MNKTDRDEIQKMLEETLATFAGQIMRHVDERADKTDQKLDERFNALTAMNDNLASRVSDDEVERAAITVEQNRHKVWIDQLAETTGTKLVATDG